MSRDIMKTGTYRVTFPCGHVSETVDEFDNEFPLDKPMAMLMGQEIEPCPICGAEAEIEEL